MYTVKIVNKLDDLYCLKAEKALDKLLIKFYGINCPNNEYCPKDIDLRILILEYYKQFSETNLIKLLKNNKCLKQLINA